jgi:hypothetical protein
MSIPTATRQFLNSSVPSSAGIVLVVGPGAAVRVVVGTVGDDTSGAIVHAVETSARAIATVTSRGIKRRLKSYRLRQRGSSQYL